MNNRPKVTFTHRSEQLTDWMGTNWAARPRLMRLSEPGAWRHRFLLKRSQWPTFQRQRKVLNERIWRSSSWPLPTVVSSSQEGNLSFIVTKWSKLNQSVTTEMPDHKSSGWLTERQHPGFGSAVLFSHFCSFGLSADPFGRAEWPRREQKPESPKHFAQNSTTQIYNEHHSGWGDKHGFKYSTMFTS